MEPIYRPDSVHRVVFGITAKESRPAFGRIDVSMLTRSDFRLPNYGYVRLSSVNSNIRKALDTWNLTGEFLCGPRGSN
jgi:hypothetical protein